MLWSCVWRIADFWRNQLFATHISRNSALRALHDQQLVFDRQRIQAATVRTPPGRARRARVTSRWAIRMNSNLIGGRPFTA